MKLRILADLVETIGRIHRLSRKVARQDAALAKQIREASSSVGLNAGEGLYARGGNRTKSLETAMNSGREVNARASDIRSCRLPRGERGSE